MRFSRRRAKTKPTMPNIIIAMLIHCEVDRPRKIPRISSARKQNTPCLQPFACVYEQNNKHQDITCGFDKLNRKNRNTDRCTADRIAVVYGNRSVNYSPVTASGKETADSPNGVGKRNCGNNNSRVFIEAGFFCVQIYPTGKHADDEPSVEYQSAAFENTEAAVNNASPDFTEGISNKNVKQI